MPRPRFAHQFDGTILRTCLYCGEPRGALDLRRECPTRVDANRQQAARNEEPEPPEWPLSAPRVLYLRVLKNGEVALDGDGFGSVSLTEEEAEDQTLGVCCPGPFRGVKYIRVAGQ